MNSPCPTLPRLAFGNASAVSNDDLEAFTAVQRSAMPTVRRYEPLDGTRAFRHRCAQARIGDLRLTATASTPLAVEVDDSPAPTLLIPFHGWSTSVLGGREYRWHAGGSAMYLPGSRRTGTSGVRSVLSITFDPSRLEATARSMLGPTPDRRLALRLESARIIPLSPTRSPAMAILKQVLPLIDLATGREEHLHLLGVDGMLYRLIALMLAPESLAPGFTSSHVTGADSAVHRVTEHIVNHLADPLSVEDLANIGGLSIRTLQVAFRRTYNCSPRDWIQRRRLVVAREKLLDHGRSDTLEDIASSCGFSSAAALIAAYSRRYGETPTAALGRTGRP